VLHACVTRFDVTKNLEKKFEFLDELNKALIKIPQLLILRKFAILFFRVIYLGLVMGYKWAELFRSSNDDP
jgi:hypothetical protein